jgi:hypothetical protein
MKSNRRDLSKPLTLNEYYSTKWWREFRFALLDNKYCKCDLCGRLRWESYKRKQGWKKPIVFNIHHKVYHLFKEKKDDVLVLCLSCHQWAHDTEMMSRTRGGVYTEAYTLLKEKTPWLFERYKGDYFKP